MRSFTILFFIGFSTSIIAQTNVISAKSHSGDITQSHHEPDNFGMPPMEITIDTVILLNNKCLIEVKSNNLYGPQRDTICNHPYLKESGTNLNKIKKRYPSNTKFVGFKKSTIRNSNDQSFFFNRVDLFGYILLVSFLIYSFSPAYRKR